MTKKTSEDKMRHLQSEIEPFTMEENRPPLLPYIVEIDINNRAKMYTEKISPNAMTAFSASMQSINKKAYSPGEKIVVVNMEYDPVHNNYMEVSFCTRNYLMLLETLNTFGSCEEKRFYICTSSLYIGDYVKFILDEYSVNNIQLCDVLTGEDCDKHKYEITINRKKE